MAEVYQTGGTEGTVILAVRQDVIQGFDAPDWLDLRVGWFVSICDPSDDALITGLGPEENGDYPPTANLHPTDRFWVGLKDRGEAFPKEQGRQFIGFTNASVENRPDEMIGNSKLITSDIRSGHATNFFWRPTNTQAEDLRVAMITDSRIVRAFTNRNSQLHLVQNVAGAGGYASLWMMRLTRPQTRSRTVTVTIKVGDQNGDVLYSSDPSFDNLLTNLLNFPDTVQQMGPVEMSRIPDAFFAFWPFTGSRLRIHAMGFVSLRT